MHKAVTVSPEVTVLRDSAAPAQPGDGELQRWVALALAGRPASLAVRIVDEAESRALNARYREQDKATNVLSFPAELPPAVSEALDQPPLGDLVICAPVVAAEAAAQGKGATAHWAHMTIHGVLHLLGFEHDTEASATVMEQHEIDLLAGLGFADPYAN
jgi:probable rRNA maturation factor